MFIHAELQIKWDGKSNAKKTKESSETPYIELRWLRKGI